MLLRSVGSHRDTRAQTFGPADDGGGGKIVLSETEDDDERVQRRVKCRERMIYFTVTATETFMNCIVRFP